MGRLTELPGELQTLIAHIALQFNPIHELEWCPTRYKVLNHPMATVKSQLRVTRTGKNKLKLTADTSKAQEFYDIARALAVIPEWRRYAVDFYREVFMADVNVTEWPEGKSAAVIRLLQVCLPQRTHHTVGPRRVGRILRLVGHCSNVTALSLAPRDAWMLPDLLASLPRGHAQLRELQYAPGDEPEGDLAALRQCVNCHTLKLTYHPVMRPALQKVLEAIAVLPRLRALHLHLAVGRIALETPIEWSSQLDELCLMGNARSEDLRLAYVEHVLLPHATTLRHLQIQHPGPLPLPPSAIPNASFPRLQHLHIGFIGWNPRNRDRGPRLEAFWANILRGAPTTHLRLDGVWMSDAREVRRLVRTRESATRLKSLHLVADLPPPPPLPRSVRLSRFGLWAFDNYDPVVDSSGIVQDLAQVARELEGEGVQCVFRLGTDDPFWDLGMLVEKKDEIECCPLDDDST